MKEYFDVLDENGNLTGLKKLRNEVHRDGDWHKAVHIWIINENGEILLQRRCATKDSNPNMLDISCAGHLKSGDNSLDGALRELKEELNIEVNPIELNYIKTLKRSSKYTPTFINNEFDDLYILRTNKTIEDMKAQEDEISEIFYVPYIKFKEMVKNKQTDLLMHTEEFEILFNLFDKEFGNLLLDAKFAEDWCNKLKEYWFNKDIKKAVSLFENTTFYQETPFLKPYTTFEEINQEWQHIRNEDIKKIEIKVLAIDNNTNTVIAEWYLEQNNKIYDGIYEIKFNNNLQCIYFKSWEMIK